MQVTVAAFIASWAMLRIITSAGALVACRFVAAGLLYNLRMLLSALLQQARATRVICAAPSVSPAPGRKQCCRRECMRRSSSRVDCRVHVPTCLGAVGMLASSNACRHVVEVQRGAVSICQLGVHSDHDVCLLRCDGAHLLSCLPAANFTPRRCLCGWCRSSLCASTSMRR